MAEQFSEILRRENAADWAASVGHRFVRELIAGTVPDEVMARYLVQDHRFIDDFLGLLGAAVATTDSFAARIRLGRFIGVIASDENTYFLRAFEELGLSETARAAVPDAAPTAGFKAIMREAAATRSYAAILAVLNVAEGLYLDWAMGANGTLPARFIHAEWITLHDNPDFRDLVGFLRAELDRVGPQQAAICRDFFGRAVALEREFFDAAYAAEPA